MSAVWLLAVRSLRIDRRGIAATALIVALAGGVALTALAGARRTTSAFPRYLASSHASDLSVNFGPIDQDVQLSLDDAIALGKVAGAIDGVVGDASYIGPRPCTRSSTGRSPAARCWAL